MKKFYNIGARLGTVSDSDQESTRNNFESFQMLLFVCSQNHYIS